MNTPAASSPPFPIRPPPQQEESRPSASPQTTAAADGEYKFFFLIVVFSPQFNLRQVVYTAVGTDNTVLMLFFSCDYIDRVSLIEQGQAGRGEARRRDGHTNTR